MEYKVSGKRPVVLLKDLSPAEQYAAFEKILEGIMNPDPELEEEENTNSEQ